MQHADPVPPSLLDAEIGLCRPGQQIGTAFGSDQQLVGKTGDDPQARVGSTLREGFPEVAEAQPEILAHHFTQADAFREYRKAVEFGEDGICGLGPDKRFWVSIVLGKVSVDSAL